jgi:CRP/FNR family cyclic AMP-dependent transcriptional regulator
MYRSNGAAGEPPFFEALNPQQADAVRERAAWRSYQRGTALFHELQGADRVIIILAGRVKVICISEDGREVLLDIRGPGDLIGEMSALDDEPRSASAIALEPVDALVLTASQFRGIMDSVPGISRLVTQTLSRRLRDSDCRRLEFAVHDTGGRVAARLLELSERYGVETPDGLRIDLPISQQELASWTGSSREAVGKALHAMRELGWLRTQRRSITVLDLAALRSRCFVL